MSRFAIDEPDPYADTPHVRCITPFCEEDVDVPGQEVFCYVCRCRHLKQEARAIAALAAERPKGHAAHVYGSSGYRRRR